MQGAGERSGESYDQHHLFTSFTRAPRRACTVGSGVNRLYAVSIFDGNPLTNLDGSVDDDVLTETDRFIVLDTGMAVIAPSRIQTEDGLLICVGTQCFSRDELPIGPGTLLRRTYWFEDEIR